MPTMGRDEQLPDGKHHYTDHLTAVLRDEGEAEQAAQDLRAAGFDDVEILEGPHALQTIGVEGYETNRLARAWERLWIQGSDQDDDRQLAAQALRQGHTIVMVSTTKGARRDLAEGILKAHQGRALRYFGRWTITDLGE